MKYSFKILFVIAVSCCFLFSISCTTHSGNKTASITTASLNDSNSAIRQFMHFFGDTLPVPVNYVSDYDNLFSYDQAKYLNKLLDSFDRRTTVQIAVVTFNEAMVSQQNFEPLTLQLANVWEVGDNNKNNGIVVCICTGYRKIRIQNGKGIVQVLSDSATKVIIDSSFIPYYKSAEYFKGTVTGVRAIIQKLNMQ